MTKINNYRTYIIGNFRSSCAESKSHRFYFVYVDFEACNRPYPRPAPAVDDISKDVSAFNGKSVVFNDFQSNYAEYR